ncbi:hypothetical protein Nepgr_026941 [Nepenthes gracilis]|uniref:Uncharacterized protein n=1 Tax=Nepenthes gracilis TaxID=150966 RepID=A0AAD3T842_NEPGR|nr:hypothetical protein Nepgr_026941 [Nepenthes gracilis]
MEEDTKANSGVVEKVIENSTMESIEVKESKKEDEQSSLDGEFIKVEKDDEPSSMELSPGKQYASREILEAEEKIKEFELELGTMAIKLKDTESENAQLKHEASLTKEKLDENGKKHRELELDNKQLQKKMLEAEENYNQQLKTLQDSLEDQVSKLKEFTGVKEALDSLNLELEISKKKMVDLEQELQSSTDEARKFEEMNKLSGSSAESETKRALEFERLLEVAKVSAKEMEDQMGSLKVEAAFKSTSLELSAAQEELEATRANLLDLEKTIFSKDILINEMVQELEQLKNSEHQLKEDISTKGSLLSLTKDDLQMKISELEEIQLKLKEEVSARVSVEAALKTQEEQVIIFKNELSRVASEKLALEETLADLTNNVELMKDRNTDLESAVSKLVSQNSELEAELKNVADRCVEHEGKANVTHQRSLELEDLIQSSNSKIEDAERRVSELEYLLEAEKSRVNDLLRQMNISENKREDTEKELKKYSNMVSELKLELEKFQLAMSNLENALHVTEEEKRNTEKELSISIKRLQEDEYLLEALQSELTLTQGKLESIENDLKAAGMRESEIMEKLRSAETQLEEQGKVIEQATTRNKELEYLHESVARDSQLKIQEAVSNITKRDSEVKSLSEKLKLLEDQIQIYEEQIAEAATKSASLMEKLHHSTTKVASLEVTNDEQKMMISEAEDKAAQLLSENQILVDTNRQLLNKVNELQESLDSAISEKESTALQIASHVNTITELTDQHTKARELQSAGEARTIQVEAELEKTSQKLATKEQEVQELSEKLSAIEAQMKTYENEAHEASEIAESRKAELEQNLLKLQDQEKLTKELQENLSQLQTHSGELAEANMKLNEELAGSESKLNDLQTKLSAALTHKDDAIEQLQSSKKEIEDLTQQLTSERQKLQSEVSSVMEENRQLHETSIESKKELQNMIKLLQGQLKECELSEEALKDEVKNLRIESAQKLELQARLKELEEKFLTTEAQLKEEVKSVHTAAIARETDLTSSLEQHLQKAQDRDALQERVLQLEQELQHAQTTTTELREQYSKQASEREGVVKQLSEELDAKIQRVLLLEKQTEELQEKLQVASTASNAKGEKGSSVKQDDGMELQSRDIGSSISTPTKRKSKKKSETSSAQTLSVTGNPTQTTEASVAMNFKFVLGVALFSIIVGIILGKRY